MPSKKIKQPLQPTLADLSLQPVFSENRVLVPAPALEAKRTVDDLPPPRSLLSALPRPASASGRPRILFADDEAPVLDALALSAKTWFLDSLDVKTWRPSQGDLLAYLDTLEREDKWQPELLVLDINLAQGGKSGIEYLEAIRNRPGWCALPVVLATANLLRDLDLNRFTDARKNNLTRVEPKEWLHKAQDYEPEAFLYGKTGEAAFIRQLGENLPVWKQVARRRTWNRLLSEVAELLDGHFVGVEQRSRSTSKSWSLQDLGKQVADFLGQELGIDDAMVRWRMPSGKYQLVGAHTTIPNRQLGHQLEAAAVPLLEEVVNGRGEPVLNNQGVTKEKAGVLADYIAGSKFLGVGAVLDGRCVGFLALLRRPSESVDFDGQIDGKPLALLARYLASAAGRARSLDELRVRDDKLLKFANDLAIAITEAEVASQLARLLQDVLHQGEDAPDDPGELSVRLVNFREGTIYRAGRVGRKTIDEPIRLWTPNSVIARVIHSGEAECHGDLKDAPPAKGWLDTGVVRGQFWSELCVPLRVGEFSIGAANAEHLEKKKYGEGDQRFAASAANLAALAVMRLRAKAFMLAMTQFAAEFDSLRSTDLRQRLTAILETFSGASAVAWLSPGTGSGEPWQVDDVEVHLEGGDRAQVKQELEHTLQSAWTQTRFGRWAKDEVWEEESSSFSNQGGRPIQLRAFASADEVGPGKEQSMAVLWLRPDQNAKPVRAVMLLWLFSPPLTDADITLLREMARLWSILESRHATTESWMQTAILGEQAAALGYVMQHFQHRLRGSMGALTGIYERMQSALKKGVQNEQANMVAELGRRIAETGQAFDKSLGYIKVPARIRFLVKTSVEQQCDQHRERAKKLRVEVEVAVGPDLASNWDEDIFRLSLFTLIDNALDELERAPAKNQRILISGTSLEDGVSVLVSDSGPGVPTDRVPKLFKFGETSKSKGLGSALAFARLRMRLIEDGDLKLAAATDGPAGGASFDIWMPHRNPLQL